MSYTGISLLRRESKDEKRVEKNSCFGYTVGYAGVTADDYPRAE